MAKKKSRKVPNRETIHFRPGEELGRLISDAAKQLSISRGECAKRFVALAIRGLDNRFYELAERLCHCEYGVPTFDDCCHLLFVQIANENAKRGELSPDEKYSIGESFVEGMEMIHGGIKTAKEKKVEIQVHLT